MSISIVIADDHVLVRDSLRAMLETEADFTIVGEARDGMEAVELSERLQPDVLILDISMPRLNGLEAIPRVRQVSSLTRVIILTGHTSSVYFQNAMKQQVEGYLLKRADEVGFLVHAIRKVVFGERFFSPYLKV